MPKPEKIFGKAMTGIFGDVLHSHSLWHLHRNTVSTAVFVGIFCAFLPIPGQMIVAAALAIGLRCHLPLSVLLVWITNPITIAPIFYGSYLLGCFLLQQTAITMTDFSNLSASSFIDHVTALWHPLLLGSLVAGLFFGSLGYGSVRIVWRINVIYHWLTRHKKTEPSR